MFCHLKHTVCHFYRHPDSHTVSHFLFCVSVSHWRSKGAGRRVTCLRSYYGIYYCNLKICHLYTEYE